MAPNKAAPKLSKTFFEKSTKGIRERSFYTHVLASQGLSSPTFVISEVLGNEFLKYFLKFLAEKWPKT